jgi:hypothetical protein
VHFYELQDEPGKAAPENRFGLVYSLSSFKPELYLVTAYAGGTLSSTEQAQVTSRGLMTDSEIATIKQASGTTTTSTSTTTTSTGTTSGTTTGTTSGTTTGTTTGTTSGTTSGTTGTSATTTTDTQAPTVAITSPANGSTAARGSTITVSATATDNVGVSQVRFYLNNNLVCSSNSAPYSCNVTLPNGKKSVSTVQVQASDAAGNVGKASITVSNR